MPDIDIKKFTELNSKVRFLPRWWHDFHFLWRHCAQRILVVTDGGLDFNETSAGGLTEFLLALETAAPSGMTPLISIAHRNNNINAASTTMKAKFPFYHDFKFEDANKPSALMNGPARQYDQLWIFGIASGNTVSPAEKVAIEASPVSSTV